MLLDILETQLPFQKTNFILVLLHWPYTRIGMGRFWELCPLIYQNTACNLTLQIWFQFQPSYHISGSIEGTTLKITKFIPLIVVPSSTLVG